MTLKGILLKVKFIFLFFVILLSCNSTPTQSIKKEWVKGTDKVECLKDSVFPNGNSYSYLINSELQSVDIEIVLGGIQFIDTAKYYIDSMECRIVPKFIHDTPKSIFFRTGFGMTYRTLYRYSIQNNIITKTKSSFDDLREDKTNSVCPFLHLDSLKILSSKEDWNFEIFYIGKLKKKNLSEVDTYEVTDDSIVIRFKNEESETFDFDKTKLK